jgi:hypothetical protein
MIVWRHVFSYLSYLIHHGKKYFVKKIDLFPEQNVQTVEQLLMWIQWSNSKWMLKWNVSSSGLYSVAVICDNSEKPNYNSRSKASAS